MSALKVGVLALQGAFSKHLEMLVRMGVACQEVRKPGDLKDCSGIIIPGGESTAILKQLWFIDLFHALLEFSKTKPLFGTCAGLILMSREVISSQSVKPFGILDIAVERNAFGRQIESFRAPIKVTMDKGKTVGYPAVFIRAPRIRSYGSSVEVLAAYEDEPVLIREGKHLGATFHPELTEETTIHRLFISMLK